MNNETPNTQTGTSDSNTLQPALTTTTISTTTTTTTTTTETTTTSTPPHKSETLERINQWTWVNSLYKGYNTLKENSPNIVKTGLNYAENTTSMMLNIAAPVMQKIDNSLHIDHKGAVVLEKIEGTAEGLKDKVSGLMQQGKTIIDNKKDAVYETGVDLVSKANVPLNKLLYATENLVDGLLPPHVVIDRDTNIVIIDDEHPEAKTETETHEKPLPEVKDLQANPIPKMLDVGKKVQTVALSKLHDLTLNPIHTDAMAHVVDLIQTAADYIDVDKKAESIKNAEKYLHDIYEQRKTDAQLHVLAPAKEILEKNTSDIKDFSTKCAVTVVSAFAHANEVVRCQLTGKVPTIEELHKNLTDITIQTKNSIQNLSESQLKDYIEKARQTYYSTLYSLVELTTLYTPSKILTSVPLLHNGLQSWRASMADRLGSSTTTSSTSSSSTASNVGTEEIPIEKLSVNEKVEETKEEEKGKIEILPGLPDSQKGGENK